MKRSLGRSIVVVGPDGAGKSTFVSAIVSEGAVTGFEHIHSHPKVLPFLEKERTAGTVLGPHDGPAPHNVAMSVIKLLVVFLDWVAWHTIRGVRGGSVTIIERGWFDQVVDPRRYRLSPRVTGLTEMLGRLLPSPMIIVVLCPPVEVVLSRKAELPKHEVGRQSSEWQRLAPSAGSHVIIGDDAIELAHQAAVLLR